MVKTHITKKRGLDITGITTVFDPFNARVLVLTLAYRVWDLCFEIAVDARKKIRLKRHSWISSMVHYWTIEDEGDNLWLSTSRRVRKLTDFTIPVIKLIIIYHSNNTPLQSKLGKSSPGISKHIYEPILKKIWINKQKLLCKHSETFVGNWKWRRRW